MQKPPGIKPTAEQTSSSFGGLLLATQPLPSPQVKYIKHTSTTPSLSSARLGFTAHVQPPILPMQY